MKAIAFFSHPGFDKWQVHNKQLDYVALTNEATQMSKAALILQLLDGLYGFPQRRHLLRTSVN